MANTSFWGNNLFLAGQPERPGAEAPSAGLREESIQTLLCRKDRKSKGKGSSARQMRMRPCRSSDEFPSCLPFAILRAPKVYFLIYFNVYLFGAVLSASSLMHTQGFSSYREWGLLSGSSARASHCSGFSCCRAQALRHGDFRSCHKWAQ